MIRRIAKGTLCVLTGLSIPAAGIVLATEETIPAAIKIVGVAALIGVATAIMIWLILRGIDTLQGN